MKYIATGRVHPERADVNFGPVAWAIPDQGQVVARCESSQVTIILDLSTIGGFVEAYLEAEQYAHMAVGALGFSLGCGYSVELIQITEEDGTPHVFGVRPSGAAPGETLAFVAHEQIFRRVLELANRDIFFRLAVRDYLRAFADALDCATYCYRAIESLKSSFAASGHSDAWAAMHAALGTDRSSIEATIKLFAEPVRHGNWVSAKLSGSLDRWKMLTLTRLTLAKYLEHQLSAA